MKRYLALLLLYYLRFIARLQLKKNPRAVVVGVTGSVGKSSAVAAISLILSTRGRVKSTSGANSQSGIPLSLLGLKPVSYTPADWLRLAFFGPLMLLFNWEKYDYLVIEMGIDSPDWPSNMSYLLSIVRPDVGVVLGASLTHSRQFDHLVKDRSPARRAEKLITEIAREKLKLLRGISPSGIAIYNFDQKIIAKNASNISARVLTFGQGVGAKVRYKVSASRGGFAASYTYQHFEAELKLEEHLDASYASTFAAALCVGVALNVSLASGVHALRSYRAPAGRMGLFLGIRGLTLIDSTYNASPLSMEQLLKYLAHYDPAKPRLAVIGDMGELGQESKTAHRQLAQWLLKYCDQAVLFGEETKLHTLPILVSRRFPVTHFDQMSNLIAYARAKLPDNSIVLVKGSQNNIFLERAVEALLNDPADIAKLCRRGKYWDRIRSKSR